MYGEGGIWSIFSDMDLSRPIIAFIGSPFSLSSLPGVRGGLSLKGTTGEPLTPRERGLFGRGLAKWEVFGEGADGSEEGPDSFFDDEIPTICLAAAGTGVGAEYLPVVDPVAPGVVALLCCGFEPTLSSLPPPSLGPSRVGSRGVSGMSIGSSLVAPIFE